MPLFLHYLKLFKFRIFGIFCLSLLSGLTSIAVLNYINNKLLSPSNFDMLNLIVFIAILLAFLCLQVIVQFAISTLGHRIVFLLRKRIVKQIIDSSYQNIKSQGKDRILASLNSDLDSISRVFIHLPDLTQGIVIGLCTGIYLAYLSIPLLLITIVALAVILFGMHLIVAKVVKNFTIYRNTKDYLTADYQTVLDGHRELKINNSKAKQFYLKRFVNNAEASRRTIVRTDFFHFLGNNFFDVMVLMLVGVIFFLAYSFNLASIEKATTFAVTILFIRNFISAAVSSIADISLGVVSIGKLNKLEFVDFSEDFNEQDLINPNWQTIRFENVTYTYPKANPLDNNQQKAKVEQFSLEPLNFTLKRGEVTFLIGKNGSGKSTLSLLLSGLVEPTGGTIYVDEQAINTPELSHSYRGLLTSIFSDFYLFAEIAKDGEESEKLIDQWLDILEIRGKVEVINQTLSTTSLSTGQRKRLALLTAIAEQRSFIILDEWAADQDPYFRSVFYRQIIPQIKQMGITVFAISHDDAYFDVADNIFLINQGKLRILNDSERLTEAHKAVEENL
ncbi:hypothetical protein CKF54_08020 [Psittacicella hinzii]|uniref:ATP-binding cassette transporter n=1 Tax=Psittacicella hinzii TaxID=2028575 RepID=A0A3A1Y1C6_9GAMM|nr:cyclic peptide export ABC transporter [Psittacicella hinzii]RIY31038.1 hypothetical protein CKF54_08020 [Psittacicella hinzii]